MKTPFRKELVKRRLNLNREFDRRFDNVAKKYEKVTFGISNGAKYVDAKEQQIITDLIHDHLNFVDGTKVLDVGAGNGRWSRLFLSLGWKVHALDNSAEMCRVLSAIDKLSVVKGDIQEVKLDEKFDVIFSLRALKYTDLEKVLENIRRLWTRNGIMIFEVPNRFNPFYFSFYYVSLLLIHIFRNNRHLRYFLVINLYDKSSVEKAIASKGYRILRIEKLFFFPDFIYSKVNNNSILSLMKLVDKILSNILPRSLLFMAQPGQAKLS